MNGIIILWCAGTLTVCVLDLAGYPLEVTGGIALGVLLVSIAWEILLGRRERRRAREAGWTARELAALDDDVLLRELLKAAPDGRREGKYR